MKRMMLSLTPRLGISIMSARARSHSHRVLKGWDCPRVNQKLIEQFGSKVLEGPFAGLQLPPESMREQLGPYLFGIFECELESVWNLVFQEEFVQIVDIGAQIGYYAVGLARRFPNAEVIAFDTDWWARRATKAAARLNRVPNVTVKCFCSPAWMARNLRSPALIVSDCEGYERILFAPRVCDCYRHTTLIIETHDCFVPGVCQDVRRALETTHFVQEISSNPKRRIPTANLDFLNERERNLATQEARPSQQWLVCRPRTRRLEAI